MPTTRRTYTELAAILEAANINLASGGNLSASMIRALVRAVFGGLLTLAQEAQDNAGGPGSRDAIDQLLSTLESILSVFPET